MQEDQEDCSYLLDLGGDLRWRFTAADGAESWLQRMADILNLRAGRDSSAVEVEFKRRTSLLNRIASRLRIRRSDRTLEPAHARRSPGAKPIMRDFGSIKIWSNPQGSSLLCELSPSRSHGQDLVMMWYALHTLYPGIIKAGGVPVHAALVTKAGVGALLVGGEGAGKSTCCNRLPDSWSVLADDGALIVPKTRGSYAAHPLPTWSELIGGRTEKSCRSERGIILSAVFFPEKSQFDEVSALGQGQAALMINASASYVARQGWKHPDPRLDRDLKRTIFDNACRIGEIVPAFALRTSRSGQFWRQMEQALGSLGPTL